MLHIPHNPCCNVAHHERRSLKVRQRHIYVSGRSHCCLVHAVGPVGVIRDPKNLEIPLHSGKAITTEALQARKLSRESLYHSGCRTCVARELQQIRDGPASDFQQEHARVGVM